MRSAGFTQLARIGLLAQTAYYEALHPGLGARFRSEAESASQRATVFSLHGKPSTGGTRRRWVNDFPFAVIYTDAEYGVLVHAVADQRRLPEYWHGGLP